MEILGTFFARAGVTHHVRELARRLGRSPTMIGEELLGLERAGILTSERIGRARRYRVDEDSPFAAEIRSLVQKTIGVEARVRQALTSVAGVEEAFLFGSFAKGSERATSDLDLFVVGSMDQELLSERIGEAERDLGRDINVVSYSAPELDRLINEAMTSSGEFSTGRGSPSSITKACEACQSAVSCGWSPSDRWRRSGLIGGRLPAGWPGHARISNLPATSWPAWIANKGHI